MSTPAAAPLSATRAVPRSSLWRTFMPPVVVLVMAVLVGSWVASAELDSIEKRTLNFDYISDRVREHLILSVSASILVALLAIPLGILIHRSSSRTLRSVALAVANVGQATPAVGLVILLAIVWKTGFSTALIAIVAYAFLPVLRNTLTGLAEVDGAVRESALGMGMTPSQVLRKIELPLASPVILAGLRTSLVFAVGVATIATFINAGGLGDMIINGLKLQRYPVLLVGAGLVAAIAILIDWLAGLVEDRVRPRGL